MLSVAFPLLATALFVNRYVEGSSFYNSTAKYQSEGVFTCPDDSGYYPHDETLCQTYYVCYQKEPYLAICPPEQLFDVNTSECAEESRVDCGKEVEDPDRGLECPETDGLFPHPRLPGRFIQCEGGYPHAMACPSGLVFRPTDKYCVWPKSQPEKTM